MSLDDSEKSVKEVLVVARPWRRLGVVLNAHDGQRTMLQSLHGVIVQVYVADLDLRRQTVRVNRVAVVLRRNMNPPRWLSP